MTLEWLWEDSGNTLEWFWGDSRKTVGWLWDDCGMTVGWLCDDCSMTVGWEDSRKTLGRLWEDSGMTVWWLWDDTIQDRIYWPLLVLLERVAVNTELQERWWFRALDEFEQDCTGRMNNQKEEQTMRWLALPDFLLEPQTNYRSLYQTDKLLRFNLSHCHYSYLKLMEVKRFLYVKRGREETEMRSLTFKNTKSLVYLHDESHSNRFRMDINLK